jgi:hypothetical protein
MAAQCEVYLGTPSSNILCAENGRPILSPDIADYPRARCPKIEAKEGVGINRPCLFALARARPLSWFVDDAADDAIADSLSLITWGSTGGKAAGSRAQWRGRPFSWCASSMSPACATDELKGSAKPKGANACCSGDARSTPQHDPNYEARETILDGWAMQCSRPDLVARSHHCRAA